ncbi:hypothetical protein DHW03_14500 [Pedobacter yonginense]|uniref:Uncharacterized protein n=1 Tax=Pedobacter yonginense TaxID=651869 RepID=A0A317EKL2_9SPHI|nr:hypothetical protein [Pedobacter yonginense]PWS27202.1 hypothetical protein DHW03_14500 [Pedobacter yonginense]
MKTLKKLSLIFSVFLLTFFGEIAVNLACGGEVDPYDYYISYFHNNVQGDEYLSFAYNQMQYLNSEEEIADETQINSKEWAKYLDVKAEDVHKVMYETDSATGARLANYTGKMAELPDSLQKNTFVERLSKQKNALKYYLFAKSCEPYANVNFDFWDPKPRDTAAMALKAKEAVALAESEEDTFLKLRYGYQAQRMFHYAGLHSESKTTYEQFIDKSKEKSAVKGWALALYAGSIRRLGNPKQSAFLFSKVFAQSPERRIQAYKNFNYNSASVVEILKYAKSNEERANIWAIGGFGNPEPNIESLNKVYQYEPKSLLNGALLVREINKLEQAFIKDQDIARITYSYYPTDRENPKYQDSVKNVNQLYLNGIKNFALKLAAEKKYPQPELGILTAAYLSWLENNDLQASNYLGSLNPDKLPERLRDQYRITDLLIKAKNIKKGNPFNENDLLATLKWLDEKRFAENNNPSYGWASADNRFSRTTRNFYQQILAPAYLKLGDTAKAALAMVKGDLKSKTLKENSLFQNMSYQTSAFWQKYLTPKSMQGLAVYKTKTAGDDVTSLLAKALNQLKNDDFYELYGTTYLRTHQYDKAVQMFAKVSAQYQFFNPENWYASEGNSKIYANPFLQTINDYPKQYVSAKAAITKKSFAIEMLRLQRLITSDGKNAALYYYQMANAVYQTGYFGSSWFLISYDWSSYDNSNPPKYGYDVDYKKAETAKAWYLKARALSTNADFKAKCTFMLAKCLQKQIIMNTRFVSFGYYDRDDVKYKNFIRANYNNPYFIELKLKYSKTPFYQTASSACSYLGDFIAGK